MSRRAPFVDRPRVTWVHIGINDGLRAPPTPLISGKAVWAWSYVHAICTGQRWFRRSLSGTRNLHLNDLVCTLPKGRLDGSNPNVDARMINSIGLHTLRDRPRFSWRMSQKRIDYLLQWPRERDARRYCPACWATGPAILRNVHYLAYRRSDTGT